MKPTFTRSEKTKVWDAFRQTAVGFAVAALMTVSLTAQDLPVISANDNRSPAGELRDGVLHLELEVKRGLWYPESEKGESIEVYALGEVGKPLQVPSPTIRVPEGTVIEASVQNTLGVPVNLIGLNQRPSSGAGRGMAVKPGESGQVRFEAGAPGTYVYGGRTPDSSVRAGGRPRPAMDALLGGAFVVDPPGTDPTKDRIFVLERWNGSRRLGINGKSWPFTEQVSAEVGKEERWKVVNASDSGHPMHLHGIHYRLEGQGDGRSYEAFEEGSIPEEFTHQVPSMGTFEISWIPKEPGRWLYHCHFMPHMGMPSDLTESVVHKPEHNPDRDHMHHWDSGYAGMGGMVMGINVTGPSAIDTVNGWQAERRLKMNVGNFGEDERFYQLSLKDLNTEDPPAQSTGLTGPVLVVTQGQPTEITLTNTSKAATSIHWHGQTIESYYDGVPWWSGIGDKRAPLVEPGHEFMVKIIPERAGSFMYHTHWHDGNQIAGGVHGPMIVLPPGGEFDPRTDLPFIFSAAPLMRPFGFVRLMNGVPQPRPRQLPTGKTYRFRFMNILPLGSVGISLRSDDGPVEWIQIAKDAAEMEPAPRTGSVQLAVGETLDFEYHAEGEQVLQLQGGPITQTLIFTARRGRRPATDDDEE